MKIADVEACCSKMAGVWLMLPEAQTTTRRFPAVCAGDLCDVTWYEKAPKKWSEHLTFHSEASKPEVLGENKMAAIATFAKPVGSH